MIYDFFSKKKKKENEKKIFTNIKLSYYLYVYIIEINIEKKFQVSYHSTTKTT
jgi:hypothetical protein